MCEIFPFELFVRGVPKNPKTNQGIAIAFGRPHEFFVKILSMKTPHTLVRGHGKIKLIVI